MTAVAGGSELKISTNLQSQIRKPNLSMVGCGPVLDMQDSDPPLLPPGRGGTMNMGGWWGGTHETPQRSRFSTKIPSIVILSVAQPFN